MHTTEIMSEKEATYEKRVALEDLRPIIFHKYKTW